MMKKLSELSVLSCLILSFGIHPVQASAADKPDVTVSIDNVSVTPSELRSSNYEVPVFVRMSQNVNLNAIEFGLDIDSRCRYQAETRSEYAELYGEKLNLEMSCAVLPSVSDYAWVTWGRVTPYYRQDSSNLLMLLVRVPESAQPDDVYEIHYLSQAPNNATKTHVWYNFGTDTNYATSGTIAWEDGSVKILEETETQPPDPVYTRGDVDMNGEINVMDVIYINRAIFGKTDLSEIQIKAADVNQSGAPDFNDSLAIMRHIVRLELLS